MDHANKAVTRAALACLCAVLAVTFLPVESWAMWAGIAATALLAAKAVYHMWRDFRDSIDFTGEF